MEYKLLPKYRNRDWLLKHDFRYSERWSDDTQTAYTKQFPVWRECGRVTLEARMTVILETGKTYVDVHDLNFGNRYTPYYSRPPYYKEFIGKIDEKINAELEDCKICQYEEEEENIENS